MIDLKAMIGSWYWPKGQGRFQQGPANQQQIISPFDIPTELIQDMIQRQVNPWQVFQIDLSQAGSQLLRVPGFHFVIYGHDGTTNKAVNTQAYVNVWWGESKKEYKGFPAKHARGLSGPFQSLYLEWPAQAGPIFADVVVFSGMFQPWIDGESCT